MISGLSIAVPALGTFRKHHVSPNPTKRVPALIVDGPYRFTRNPLYLSLALIYAGLALVLASLWSLALLVPVLVVIDNHAITKEERYLERRFGNEYLHYRERVRRWI